MAVGTAAPSAGKTAAIGVAVGTAVIGTNPSSAAAGDRNCWAGIASDLPHFQAVAACALNPNFYADDLRLGATSYLCADRNPHIRFCTCLCCHLFRTSFPHSRRGSYLCGHCRESFCRCGHGSLNCDNPFGRNFDRNSRHRSACNCHGAYCDPSYLGRPNHLGDPCHSDPCRSNHAPFCHSPSNCPKSGCSSSLFRHLCILRRYLRG
mmetsp:Transcript_3381/g.4947  ORF Transcript_3381/g.4947 Transcript_3381/m.4947 type:complete len:207 (-) Transcript_3381:1844-2464(-)